MAIAPNPGERKEGSRVGGWDSGKGAGRGCDLKVQRVLGTINNPGTTSKVQARG